VNCPVAAARAHGSSRLTVSFRGISHTVTLTSVDPNRVVAAALRRIKDSSNDNPVLEDDLLTKEPPLTALNLTVTSGRCAIELTADDGTQALGGAASASVAPASIASAFVEMSSVTADEGPPITAPYIFFVSLRPGTATLSAAIGAARLSIPVTVSQ